MSGARLKTLARVTGAAQEAALARLREKAAVCDGIEAEIRALDGERHRQADRPLDTAALAGADILWLRWAEGKRAELNRALARARAARDDAKAEAARSFGRDHALRKAIEKMQRP